MRCQTLLISNIWHNYKMMKNIKALALCGASIVAIAISSYAGTAPKEDPRKIHQDQVVSVSSDSISIAHRSVDQKATAAAKKTIYKETVKVYQIKLPLTEIQVDGKRATPSDIRVGMAATVSARTPDSDGSVGLATMIVVHTVKKS
jgi:hypothetical protein